MSLGYRLGRFAPPGIPERLTAAWGSASTSPLEARRDPRHPHCPRAAPAGDALHRRAWQPLRHPHAARALHRREGAARRAHGDVAAAAASARGQRAPRRLPRHPCGRRRLLPGLPAAATPRSGRAQRRGRSATSPPSTSSANSAARRLRCTWSGFKRMAAAAAAAEVAVVVGAVERGGGEDDSSASSSRRLVWSSLRHPTRGHSFCRADVGLDGCWLLPCRR